MDGKLIDDRQSCANAIDEGDKSRLIQLQNEDMDFAQSELAQARPATMILLLATD